MAEAILNKWLADLPHQFNAQPNWEVLIRAFSEELDGVYEAIEEVNTLTSIDKAFGKNLDMIGDIVHLTRAEALNLLPDKTIGVLDDESYRACIKYQVTKLNSSCTYDDLRSALALLLGDDHNVHYKEESDHPATVILETETPVWEDGFRLLMNTPVLKASGVGLIIRAEELEEGHIVAGVVSILSIKMEAETDKDDIARYPVLVDDLESMLIDDKFDVLVFDEPYSFTDGDDQLTDEEWHPLIT